MRSKVSRFLLISCCTTWSLPSAASPASTARELAPSYFHAQTLKADLPARALHLGRRHLWIVGKTALWRWEFLAHGLKKFTLDGGELHGAIARSGGRLLVASPRGLFEVNAETAKVRFYPLPHRRLQALTGDREGRFHLLLDRGYYRVDPATRGAQRIGDWSPPAKADDVLFLPERQEAWLTAGGTLWRWSQGTFNEAPWSARQGILGMHPVDRGLVVHTRYSVILLNQRGELAGSVPVLGQHRLIRANLHPKEHTYLFSDRIIEKHLLGSREVRYYSLELGYVRKAHWLEARESMVALIVDGKPRLFQLSGRW